MDVVKNEHHICCKSKVSVCMWKNVFDILSIYFKIVTLGINVLTGHGKKNAQNLKPCTSEFVNQEQVYIMVIKCH